MKKSKMIMLIGLLLMTIALILTAYNVIESKQAKYYSTNVMEIMNEHIPSAKSTDLEELSEDTLVDFSGKNMPVINFDEEAYIGYLYVPQIGLNLPVMDKLSYEALKKTPCRYSGTVYAGDMIIAGHNYRSHFSKIRSLPLGTEIQFTDVDGNVFFYEISDIEVLETNEVEAMHEGAWDLSLFTCNYDGSARITLRCALTGVIKNK